VDDAALLLDLVLDGPYELVDGEITEDTRVLTRNDAPGGAPKASAFLEVVGPKQQP